MKFFSVTKYFFLVTVSLIALFCIIVFILFGYGIVAGIEFIATMLGVLIAFAINAVYEQNKKEQAKRNLLNDLHTELEYVKTMIHPKVKTDVIFYPNVWDSAKSSGDLRLLDSEQLKSLTEVYLYIKESSYYAERVRDAREEFEETSARNVGLDYSGPAIRDWESHLRECHRMLQARYERRMERLDSLINEVLNEKWWKSAN